MNIQIIFSGVKTWFRVRGGILGPLVFLSLMFLVEGSFWTTISGPSGYVSDYSSKRILFYVFCALLMSQITACTGDPDRLSERIESGMLDSFLLRPSSYLSQMASLQMGLCLARLVFLLPLCWILAWIFLGDGSIQKVAMLVILMPLAALMNFLINQILSTFTFFFRESYALVIFKETLFAILAGTLIPLDLYPRGLSDVLCWAPSAYLAYYPTKVLMGEADVWLVLRNQILFVVVLGAMAALTWPWGVKKYQAFGG